MQNYQNIPIKGLENYKISREGKIINITRNKELTCTIKSGYHYVSLVNEFEKKRKSYRVHILIAMTFINNDDRKNKTFVNHKNGKKLDNRIENLEWITPTRNVVHALETGLIVPLKRRVDKYDLKNNFIETYESIKDAAEKCNIDDASIVKVCRKSGRKKAGGFKWKYTDVNENENVSEETIQNMKVINGFPNYKISKDGKIYSIAYKKILRNQINNDGYETIQLKKYSFLVHRLVAIAFIDNPEKKDQVNHINEIKSDNRVENLQWATQSENITHSNKLKKERKEKERLEKEKKEKEEKDEDEEREKRRTEMREKRKIENKKKYDERKREDREKYEREIKQEEDKKKSIIKKN